MRIWGQNVIRWTDWLVIYVILSSLIFLYVFPFIFIGIRGNYDDPMTINPTVLDIWDHDSFSKIRDYPALTQFSIQFARLHQLRLACVLLQICFVIYLIIKKYTPELLCRICIGILWFNFVLFIILLLGLFLLF